jgi:hypothetical protein
MYRRYAELLNSDKVRKNSSLVSSCGMNKAGGRRESVLYYMPKEKKWNSIVHITNLKTEATGGEVEVSFLLRVRERV